RHTCRLLVHRIELDTLPGRELLQQGRPNVTGSAGNADAHRPTSLALGRENAAGAVCTAGREQKAAGAVSKTPAAQEDLNLSVCRTVCRTVCHYFACCCGTLQQGCPM